jgi:CheY-like chemotaxis protein
VIIPQGPILVVEDVTHIRELLEVTLRFKGYPVITARNGQEGLEKIAKQKPALVITDILMPVMDGFAMAQKLRSTPDTMDLPIVFLSATYVTPEDRAFALRLGAVSFLEKPVDTEEFLLTIAEIITQGAPTLPLPLDEPTFFRGYRDRLEDKLRHKNNQITRIQRLLGELTEAQRPIFEELLDEVRAHRDQIQGELDQLYGAIENNNAK